MNKKEFTFVMLSYNQQQYVIEQMESIKYQVINYGKDYQTYFLLCDDGSSDFTVDIIRKWIQIEDIFDRVKIIVSPVNGGIVKNFITALKNIDTDQFKVLGGDDLYYVNNVYEAIKRDFVITPTLKLQDSCVFNQTKWNLKKYITIKKDLKSILLEDMEYALPIETPGIFWNHALVGEELYALLSQYNWCEDLPCWNYLLNLEKIKTMFLEHPYVLYRMNSGISLNKKHDSNLNFNIEVEKIRKEIFKKYYRYPKKINPYIYIYRLERWIYNNVFNKINDSIKCFEEELNKEAANATSYYCEIQRKAEQWVKEYWTKRGWE